MSLDRYPVNVLYNAIFIVYNGLNLNKLDGIILANYYKGRGNWHVRIMGNAKLECAWERSRTKIEALLQIYDWGRRSRLHS
jgi:hypothetical protein